MSIPKGTRKNDKTRELQNAWQKENQLTIACKIDKRTGQAFRAYATANNTTVSALVAGFVRSTLGAAGMLPDPKTPLIRPRTTQGINNPPLEGGTNGPSPDTTQTEPDQGPERGELLRSRF